MFLGLVHRIDRPVSGVVVFAKTSKSLIRLNLQFKLRETKKTYWAIVYGLVENTERQLEHWILRKPKQNKSFVYLKKIKGSKKAFLTYKNIYSFNRYTLLEINLKTGRHHQIRAQLSSIGFPIKGDLKYGAPRSNQNKGIHLHSRSLELIHPVKKELFKWNAPPPKDVLWNALLSYLFSLLFLL